VCDSDKLSYLVIGTALRIHTRIGPGCSEPIYRDVLHQSLLKQGLGVEREKHISFEFEGVQFKNRLRADLIVEKNLVVELKSQAALTAVDHQQVLTYLRLLDLRLGILLNFGELHLRDGIKRIANNYTPSRPQ
jgi:GxxExxY protein